MNSTGLSITVLAGFDRSCFAISVGRPSLLTRSNTSKRSKKAIMACVIFCTFFEVDKWRRLCQLALINSDRDGIRKAREGFLISKGKPLEPYGINRRDEI